MPVAPFVALLAASFVQNTFTHAPKKHILAGGVIILLILPSLARSLITTEIFAATERDTRFQAREWIIANIPKGTIMIQEKQTPRLPVGQYRTGTYQYAAQESLDTHRDNGVEYIMVSSEMFSRFFANDDPSYDDERAFYTELFGAHERVFVAEGNESGFRGIIGRSDVAVLRWLFTDVHSVRTIVPGPDISIYKL